MKRPYPSCSDSQDRFSEKWIPEPNSGCWLWIGGLRTGGYGQVSGNRRAHRVSYELHVRDIPEGLMVLHKCDIRLCVNPDHLFLGTAADNTADMVAKGRAWWAADRIQKGRQHGAAKLTEQQVLEIRAATSSQREIASRYGIGQSQVSGIRSRKSWAHI